jgi:hypothetical protein
MTARLPSYLVVNAGVFLATAAIGAASGAAVAYFFTDYGTVPDSPAHAIIGGGVFLLAAYVSIGLPIALVLLGLIWALTRRREIARRWFVAGALFAGLVWLAIVLSPSLSAKPALAFLLASWLLFGLLIRHPSPTEAK